MSYVHYFVKKSAKPFFYGLASLFFLVSVEELPIPKYDNDKQYISILFEYLARSLDGKNIPEDPSFTKFIFFISGLLILLFIAIFHIETINRHYDNFINNNFSRDEIWRTEIKAFANNIGLTSADRITLYIYVKAAHHFINAGRESPNPKYKKIGRRFYSSGLIEKAFDEGEQGTFIRIENDFEIDKNAYFDEVAQKSNMKRMVIRRLAMKSRFLYARQIIKLDGEPVGVLLIETTKNDLSHIKYGDSCNLDENRLNDIFKRECNRLSYFLTNLEEPRDLFSFEEGVI